jgi:hypothetical protein
MKRSQGRGERRKRKRKNKLDGFEIASFIYPMEDASYGQVNHIQIDNEIYQIQSVELNDETFFIIKRSGEVICMIMRDANNNWQPDCEISELEFNQMMSWVKKLYNLV